MSAPPERSAEEREAARREREARRDGSKARVVTPPPRTDAGPPVEPPRRAKAPPPPEATGPVEAQMASERAKPSARPARTPRPGRSRNAPRAPRTPPPHRVSSRSGRILAVLALGLTAAIIWFLVELFQPFAGGGHGTVTVTIPLRSGAGQIGDLLERDGVVNSSFFFQLRATLDGDRSQLRAGTYRLKKGMSYSDALKVLTTAPPAVPTTNVTLVEGRARSQIDALLRSQGVRGYLADTRHSRLLDPRRYGAPRDTPDLEGFLFPSTYQLRKPVQVRALIADQLNAFKQQFAHIDLRYARRRHLTPYDVLIIASIIEKEAASQDRRRVASVIYNRLKARIPLGMDSTTRYEFGDYTQPLTQSQLAARSPYNTRRNLGLPPTPISNPGLAAIQAAADPAQTNYLYFVVKPCGNGSSVFSSSYRQFLQDSARYQSARARRGGHSPTRC